MLALAAVPRYRASLLSEWLIEVWDTLEVPQTLHVNTFPKGERAALARLEGTRYDEHIDSPHMQTLLDAPCMISGYPLLYYNGLFMRIWLSRVAGGNGDEGDAGECLHASTWLFRPELLRELPILEHQWAKFGPLLTQYANLALELADEWTLADYTKRVLGNGVLLLNEMAARHAFPKSTGWIEEWRHSLPDAGN